MEATQRFCSGVEGLAAGSPRSASLRTVLMMLSEHRGVGTAGRWGRWGGREGGAGKGWGQRGRKWGRVPAPRYLSPPLGSISLN